MGVKKTIRIPLSDYTPKKTVYHTKNAFKSLSRSIIYQQISGKAAESIIARFQSLVPTKRFPTPRDVLSFSDAQFKNAGISPQKMSYLRDLAGTFENRTITPKKLHTLSDEEIREHVMLVKGIGRWTADMFLIFFLNRPNVLPYGDLGIQHGFRIVWGLRSLPSERTMLRLAKPYEGQWTKLSLYLWEVADSRSSRKL